MKKSEIKAFLFDKQKVYGVYFGSNDTNTSFVLKNVQFVKFCSTKKGDLIALRGENVALKKHWISGKISIIPIDKILYFIDLGTELEYKKTYGNKK